jgi:hypothetical protein
VQATCARIMGGDDQSWFEAWRATADRLVETGDACAAGGHRVSGRESYLRASFYYALAYHPLFGAPPDPRLLDAFGSQRAAFDKAAALLEPAGEALEIDFEGASLPGDLFRAVHGERRPASHCDQRIRRHDLRDVLGPGRAGAAARLPLPGL